LQILCNPQRGRAHARPRLPLPRRRCRRAAIDADRDETREFAIGYSDDVP
jgi:hypothetical protein